MTHYHAVVYGVGAPEPRGVTYYKEPPFLTPDAIDAWFERYKKMAVREFGMDTGTFRLKIRTCFGCETEQYVR